MATPFDSPLSAAVARSAASWRQCPPPRGRSRLEHKDVLAAIGAAISGADELPEEEEENNNLQDARLEPFRLPRVPVHVAGAPAGYTAAPGFAPHALQIDCSAVTLSALESAAVLVLPLGGIVDVAPVLRSDDQLLKSCVAPYPHLLRISARLGGGALLATVTLSLASLAECACAVRALMHFQEEALTCVSLSFCFGSSEGEGSAPSTPRPPAVPLFEQGEGGGDAFGCRSSPHPRFVMEDLAAPPPLPAALTATATGAAQLGRECTEEERMSLDSTTAQLLVNCRVQDTVQPEPLSMPRVWLYVPRTCVRFHCCSLCVDKLGLTLRPLLEGGEDLTMLAQESTGGRQLLEQLIHFPVTSVLEVNEQAIFKPTAPGDPPSRPLIIAPGGTRSVLPFKRSVFVQAKAAPWPAFTPPFRHTVRIAVKGALARQPVGPDKEVMPVAIWLSFPEKEQAAQLACKLAAYKKYHLSLAVSTFAGTLATLARREAVGHALAEEHPQGADPAASPFPAPPPPPLRPPWLPPASRLPRMLTTDEGEVFWCIPKREKSAAQPAPPPTSQLQLPLPVGVPLAGAKPRQPIPQSEDCECEEESLAESDSPGGGVPAEARPGEVVELSTGARVRKPRNEEELRALAAREVLFRCEVPALKPLVPRPSIIPMKSPPS